MASRQLGSLLVVYLSRENPTNEEWDRHLGVLEQIIRAHGSLNALVLTEGGVPSPTQRAKLVKVRGTGKSRSVILSRSAVVRAVLTALRWLHPSFLGLAPDELPKAMEFLQLEPGMRAAIERALFDLRLEVEKSLLHRTHQDAEPSPAGGDG
jgi:hypothetical protein